MEARPGTSRRRATSGSSCAPPARAAFAIEIFELGCGAGRGCAWLARGGGRCGRREVSETSRRTSFLEKTCRFGGLLAEKAVERTRPP